MRDSWPADPPPDNKPKKYKNKKIKLAPGEWPRDRSSNELFTFFWGNKYCFSNFYPAEFEVDGNRYSCNEQFIMAEKALLMGDEETRAKIMLETEPPKIKSLGRKVKPWDEQKWHAKREDIAFRGLFAKFYQNPEIRDQLVKTYPT